jgi:hypothetical protein
MNSSSSTLLLNSLFVSYCLAMGPSTDKFTNKIPIDGIAHSIIRILKEYKKLTDFEEFCIVKE